MWLDFGHATDWNFPGNDTAICIADGIRIVYQLVPPEEPSNVVNLLDELKRRVG
jgi:hypothetical protein